MSFVRYAFIFHEFLLIYILTHITIVFFKLNKFTNIKTMIEIFLNFSQRYLSTLFSYMDRDFISCIILSTISALFCSLIPHLQYKYQILSKITSDDYGKAADLLAFTLIHIGSLRIYSFIECVYMNDNLNLDFYIILSLRIFGVVLILIGAVLVIKSFHRLGLRGMYYGDHFGFLFQERIHKFPYNYFENPQYIGSIMCHLGFSLAFRSVHGLVLTLYIFLCNEFVFFFNEKKKLKVFYPQEVKKTE
jgi:phosphatidylethanolamine N-methyltransferase